MKDSPARTSSPSRLVSLATLALASVSLAAFPTAQTDYLALTDNHSDFANFFPEPFNGLHIDDDDILYAVNPRASTIVVYDGLNLGTGRVPDYVIPTGNGPVSVATWGTGADKKILSVCVGTHGLVVHRASAPWGQIEAYLQLDSEPADICVDEENDRVYVSCQGSNTVLRIGLSLVNNGDTMNPGTKAALELQHRYHTGVGQRPGPLYAEFGGPGTADDKIYVAAAVTGNKSIFVEIDGGGATGNDPSKRDVGSVIRGVESLNAGDPWDHDIFTLDPQASGSESDAVVAIEGVGSLLFDIGRNEAATNHDFWVLSTDSINGLDDKGAPGYQDDLAEDVTEFSIRGDFAVNQLVRVEEATNGTEQEDLDKIDENQFGSPIYDVTRSVNQARTMVFLEAAFGPGAAGDCFIGGPFSDVIVRTDDEGDRLAYDSTGLAEYRLDPGSRCYDLELGGSNDRNLFALCLGDLPPTTAQQTQGPKIVVFRWDNSTTPWVTLDLGYDPLPAHLRQGEEIFFDGRRSRDGRFSCASCHPRGMSDQLGWSLSGHPCDTKDVMVTQSLMSIADTYPHHWRGERDLPDFGKAFVGLLGGHPGPPQVAAPLVVATPTEAEQKAFDDFIQSLQAPANPNQLVTRQLSTDYDAAPGTPFDSIVSPGNGQTLFEQRPSAAGTGFNDVSCSECHSLETGSDGNHFFEINGSFLPRVGQLEVSHLRQLQNKGFRGFAIDPPTVTVTASLGATSFDVEVDPNGFGFGHEGEHFTMTDFLDSNVFDLDARETADVVAFMHEFDQGIAPAAHFGIYYDSILSTDSNGEQGPIESQIEDILLDGASKKWVDVVAVGEVDTNNNGTFTPLRFWYDPVIAKFVADDTAVSDTTWGVFKILANQGRFRLLFLGLPYGNGYRFGIDYDLDDVRNQNELGSEWAWSMPPNKQWLNLSITPDFVNARLAKFHIDSEEDVKYTVTSGGVTLFERKHYVRHDTFVINNDIASLPFLDSTTSTGPPLRVVDFRVDFEDRYGDTIGYLGSFEPDRAIRQVEATDVGFPIYLESFDVVTESRVNMRLEATIEADLGVLAPPSADPLDQSLSCFRVVAIVTVETAAATENVQWVQSGSDPGQFLPEFDSVDKYSSFKVNDGTSGPCDADATDYDVDEIRQGPFIVSAPTDVDGKVTFSFGQDLGDPNQRVKVVVIGAAREDPVGTTCAPMDSCAHGLPVLDQIDMLRFQMLRLEDGSQVILD